MPLEGRQLTIGWALALCHHAGWRAVPLRIAVAVMTAESQRYTRAWQENWRRAPDGTLFLHSTDRGLFQINDRFHPTLVDEDAYRPIPNAAYAFELSRAGEDWTPWAAFNSGAHERYMPEVKAVQFDKPSWQPLIERVPEELGVRRIPMGRVQRPNGTWTGLLEPEEVLARVRARFENRPAGEPITVLKEIMEVEP